MKIIMNDCVYVQKNDLIYLWNHEQEILSSIFMKVFGNGIVVVNDSNRYDFVKFDDPNEIKYFRNLDWIVDYNSVKDLSEEEFIKLGEEIALEMNVLANKFNEMSEIESIKHLDIVDTHGKLEFKMSSLRDILWFKQGYIKMTLPDDVDYSSGYDMKNKKEKGLKRILSKLKKLKGVERR